MIFDDPDFPKGSLVLITRDDGTSYIKVIAKAVKGRSTLRVGGDEKSHFMTVEKKRTRVVTVEEDPELFI